ncbi:MAG TPA: hypothetical protein VGF63_02415 [Solirubrobacteraceae bacterium]|jgi:hypothetical protein
MRPIDTAGGPPPEALHATALAGAIMRELLDAGREVRFVLVPTRARVAVAVCDRDGAVLAQLTAARVLELAAGRCSV